MSQLPDKPEAEATRKPRRLSRITPAVWRKVGALAAAGLAATLLAGGTAAASDHQASGTPMLNPLYQQASQVAFGPLAAGDTRRVFKNAAGVTPDQGIILVRAFIPSHLAAGGLLVGDQRGFTAAPVASSRGVLAWNTATGGVSLTMTHSLVFITLDGHPFEFPDPALPVRPLSYNGNFRDDSARYDNEIGIASNSASNNLQVRVSLLNSLTNGIHVRNLTLAWSVDDLLTIIRTGPGAYRFKQLTGNGYPAIEAYYYPKFIPAGSRQQFSIIGKRSVDPLFLRLAIDTGGGLAALDFLSWNACGHLPNSLTIQCTNTIPYTHATQFPYNILSGFPSQARWKAPWDTPANATNAGAGN